MKKVFVIMALVLAPALSAMENQSSSFNTPNTTGNVFAQGYPAYNQFGGYIPPTDFYQFRANPYNRDLVTGYDFHIPSMHETELGAGLPYGGLPMFNRATQVNQNAFGGTQPTFYPGFEQSANTSTPGYATNMGIATASTPGSFSATMNQPAINYPTSVNPTAATPTASNMSTTARTRAF